MRSDSPSIRTERLLLRPWRGDDEAPFAAMNADPEVMRFYPALRTAQESAEEARAHDAQLARDGFGLFALECVGGAPFIGYAGVRRIKRSMPFAPPIEVGWRLAKAFWGKGYATEAARAALSDFFARHAHEAVVSFTAVQNLRSQRVMQRLRMERDPDADFEHPALPAGHSLRRHVLYRLHRSRFEPAGAAP